MIKEHLQSVLIENLGYTPTSGQQKLMEKLAGFFLSGNNNEIFLIKGYAGTGKTTVVSSIVTTLKNMKLKTVLLAPTGRAAKVLSSYSGKSAFTIHKKIYRQKSSTDGFGTFVLDKNLHSSTYFLVDEASMISNISTEFSGFGSGHLLDDLISYVYNDRKCKLILIGDTAQLPPVGLETGSALDIKQLEGYGKIVSEVFLDEVVRQAMGSGILKNATTIRQNISFNKMSVPKLKLKNLPDIQRISGVDLPDELNMIYDRAGIDSCILICRSNKQTNNYNKAIRNRILWREEEICNGDRLMIVKNNYFWMKEIHGMDFIANGDIVEIVRIKKYDELYGYQFADVTLRFVDYQDIEIDAKINLGILYINSASMSYEENKNFYQAVSEDYAGIKQKRKRFLQIREDPYFNALQVKFAYSVTCHKAQGGQWKVVFVDQGYLPKDFPDMQYLRWLYTAVTRATKKLYLVNFRDEFFEESHG